MSMIRRFAAAGIFMFKAPAVDACLAAAVLDVVLMVPSCTGPQRREDFIDRETTLTANGDLSTGAVRCAGDDHE
jgi:hypothetical protein